MQLKPTEIVETALAARRLQPDAAAIDVLDEAMAGQHGTDPDFEAVGQPFSDWLSPASPFAQLLRMAFAPDLTDDDLSLAADPSAADGRSDSVASRWLHGVIEAFAFRYRLWSA